MIGLLTFHRGPNYGGFLQAWHMREAIRSLGQEVDFVNYQTEAHFLGEKIKRPPPSIGGLKGFVLHVLKSRAFAADVAAMTSAPFTTDPLRVPWEGYSKVVLGADIIWNFSNPQFGPDPVWFAAHPAQEGTEFVAYAPSCGDADVDGPLPEFVTRGLRRLGTAQVRDDATARLFERATGRRPELVVDPTWLGKDPEIAYRRRPRRPYALVYGFGVRSERAAILGAYCRRRGLDLVSCAIPCKTADRMISGLGPFEWVDLFRHAECVITSTFHGLLYAIKYNKPLVFMVRGPSRSKSSLALERCGLRDRVVEEGAPFDAEHLDHCLTRTDGCEVPEHWRRESLERLRGSVAT